MGDQIFTGIMAGESAHPNHAIRRATKITPIRVFLIYILSLVFIGLLIPQDDSRFFGSSDAEASPWTIAANDAGIPVLGHIVNVVLLFGVLSLGGQSIYLASRVLRAASHQRLVPGIFAKADKQGRPVVALIVSGIFGIIISYINLSDDAAIIYDWLVAVTSSAFFSVWLAIAWLSFRFRKALELQEDGLLNERFAVRCWLWPLPPIVLSLVSSVLLVCCVYTALEPVDGVVDVVKFFQNTIGLLIILGFTLAYELIKRTGFRNLATADLQTGRLPLSEQEITDLDVYFQKPAWRRFWTYFKLW